MVWLVWTGRDQADKELFASQGKDGTDAIMGNSILPLVGTCKILAVTYTFQVLSLPDKTVKTQDIIGIILPVLPS